MSRYGVASPRPASIASTSARRNFIAGRRSYPGGLGSGVMRLSATRRNIVDRLNPYSRLMSFKVNTSLSPSIISTSGSYDTKYTNGINGICGIIGTYGMVKERGLAMGELPVIAGLEGVDDDATPIPNELYDEWLGRLKPLESALLMFIMLHAWRVRSRVACISYGQFIYGSIDATGKRLDWGCGIKSAATIANKLRSIEKLGLIVRHEQIGRDGNPHIYYELRIGIYGGANSLVPARFVESETYPAPRPAVTRFEGKRAWEAIKEHYGSRCVDCGRQEPEIELTRDHIIPVSRGGANTADNIAPRCRSCNSRKSNRIPITE